MFEDLKRDILRTQLVDEDGLILEACGKQCVRELMIDDQDDMSDYDDDPDIERLIDAIPEDTSEEACTKSGNRTCTESYSISSEQAVIESLIDDLPESEVE